jgi:hypothetical protein
MQKITASPSNLNEEPHLAEAGQTKADNEGGQMTRFVRLRIRIDTQVGPIFFERSKDVLFI